MNFSRFRKKYCGYPLIKAQAVLASSGKAAQPMRNQLARWKRNGLLIQLRRGIYILNENDRKVAPSRFFFANQITWPSYVSLESALSHYGCIPEAVKDITSVTSKKTAVFKNKAGEFVYRHLKPEAFRGYRSFKDEAGLDVFIAEPEKALVDFLYLNLNRFKGSAGDIFKESYRFQNTGILNQRKIIFFSRIFKNKRLEALIRDFCAFMEEERK
jgi:predicted transcriptional regulator of viral defense system